MPSLVSIPEPLLAEGKSTDFLVWLMEQPIDITIARELMSKYAKTLGEPFTPNDYQIIKEHYEPAPDA